MYVSQRISIIDVNRSSVRMVGSKRLIAPNTPQNISRLGGYVQESQLKVRSPSGLMESQSDVGLTTRPTQKILIYETFATSPIDEHTPQFTSLCVSLSLSFSPIGIESSDSSDLEEFPRRWHCSQLSRWRVRSQSVLSLGSCSPCGSGTSGRAIVTTATTESYAQPSGEPLKECMFR